MKRKLSKKVLVASFLLPLATFTGAKIHQLAAQPSKEKDCDFIYPSNDSGKTTTITIKTSTHPVEFQQKGGASNDASCLNKTLVHGIVKIKSEEDIKNALLYAHSNELKVSSAGQQHTMGGQTFVQNGLVLDMKGFNMMKLDKENKILNVQSGAIWADIQQHLDKEGLAVKAMQSINIFTVGGTLSVNAHGIAHIPGPIAPTVKSMRVMLSNGEIKTASREHNTELFKLVLGGYGLFGVILDVDLEVMENEVYTWKRDFMTYTEFPKYYKNNIENNNNVGLMYGRLSVSPSSYLTDIIIHKYEKVTSADPIPVLQFPKHTWINRLVINFSKTGGVGRWTRWILEKYAEPQLHLCSRNQAMSQKEVCLVSRNQEMYDAMGYLKNKLKDTDILQEYFIPHERMSEFVDGLRKTVKQNGANLLNVTIRIVSKDIDTALPYAKEDMFAFVLYFNQKLNEEDSAILRKTTTDLIDVATNAGGTYYLPYQLYYSNEQLHKAYPEIDNFFQIKKKYDPIALFTNKFFEKYGNK